MYKPGDYVLCKSGGVWRVTAVHEGQVELKSHENPGEIQTLPVDSGEIVRGVIPVEELQDVLSRIPYTRTIQAPGAKVRMEFYRDAMEKYDELQWVRVIKTVYMQEREKRLMPDEREYGMRAKRYLHGEISALLGIPFDQVEEFIATSIADDVW